MEKSGFYGTTSQTSLSYLEFGAIDLAKGTKAVWDFKINQKAYDWLMFARYANDMAAYLEMTEALPSGGTAAALEVYRREVHHRDDFSVNLGKLLALSVLSRDEPRPSFFELGQTLLGCIEGMEFCRALLRQLEICPPLPELKELAWQGVDISRFFNRFAVAMHTGYAVSVHDELGKYDGNPSLFFAKGVTLLYAIRSLDSLFQLLERSEMALFDYSLSAGAIQEVTIGTGKAVRYLPLADFMNRYARSEKKIYVKKGNSAYSAETGRIFIDCVFGTQDKCGAYIDLDRSVRAAIVRGIESAADRASLLDDDGDRNGGWMLLEDFINGIGFGSGERR